jgi:hypothetical protein
MILALILTLIFNQHRAKDGALTEKTMSETEQTIWDWCDTMSMKHPFFRDCFVKRALELIAEGKPFHVPRTAH